MSKRSRDTGRVFDALVHAIVGLGAVPSWAELPPATAPGSLVRALGQGVLHGRLPRDARGACVGKASPLPTGCMTHEGQRSVAELGAILWHAMGGPALGGDPAVGGGVQAHDAAGLIEGRFCGPSHQEAGGIFERDRLTGAFGGSRWLTTETREEGT